MSWFDKLIEGNVVRERSYTAWNDIKSVQGQTPKSQSSAEPKKTPEKTDAKKG